MEALFYQSQSCVYSFAAMPVKGGKPPETTTLEQHQFIRLADGEAIKTEVFVHGTTRPF
jgi:hypothetical protein